MAEGGRCLIKCRFEDDATELEVYDVDFPFQAPINCQPSRQHLKQHARPQSHWFHFEDREIDSRLLATTGA